MHRYEVRYQNRRLPAIRETIRLSAPDEQTAIDRANDLMVRHGYKLLAFKKPLIRREL